MDRSYTVFTNRKGAFIMDYVETVKARLQAELKAAGYDTNDNGAHKIYESVFIDELDKLNQRLEALENPPA